MPTIWMVDDDPDDRYMLNRALKEINSDIRMEGFEDGEKMLAELAKTERCPDVMFIDLNMPGIHGFEVIKRIKHNSENRHIPVVVYSTSNYQRDISTAYDLGANTYISKPESYSAIVKMLRCIEEYWFKHAALVN